MVLHRPVELAVEIGNLKYWDWTCPVTRLSRNFLIKDELVRAVGRGGPPFF